MVGQHFNRMRSAFEVVAKLLEAFDNREKLTVMRLVVQLSCDQLSGPESDWVPLRRRVAFG